MGVMLLASRGVIYIVWGERIEAVLKRSMDALKAIHPELPVEVIRPEGNFAGFEGIYQKTEMAALSPFEETLFLDADTVPLSRLDYGFDQAARFGLACCICELPWARRYGGMAKDDAVEYNTGVLFFSRAGRPVFDAWEVLAPKIESSNKFIYLGKNYGGRMNDQASFAAAVAQWDRAPFVLPLNWNFRPKWQWSWFGPIKIWHDYGPVPPALLKQTELYKDPEAVVRFHFIRPPAPQQKKP